MYLLLIPSIVFLMLACKKPKNNLYSFDPRILTENEIILSEIGDEITYIPLDNSIPLGPIFNIEFINNAIFFSSKDIGILEYDRYGRLIRKIGSIGRGPEQYIYSPAFTVDDKNKNIYVLDLGGKIKVYTEPGKFKRNILLKEYGDMIDAIKFHDSKLFVTYALQFGNSKYKWIVFDTLGRVVAIKKRMIPMFSANSGGREAIYSFENKISYFNSYTDTVFSIRPDLFEEPSFIICPGEHRIPKSNLSLEQVLNWNYLQINTVFETNHFFVIQYYYNKPAILIFDKRNKVNFLKYLEYDGKTGDLLSGIENDLDGGPWFIPECYFSEMGREYMVGLQYPYQIKAYLVSDEFRKSTPKYPEKKKEFEKLANSLKETDNPVLMIVRLKK